ncbi:hypothetical protein, partial [Blautia sp. OM07-19]|uniref:hypothetical protein n=1 Tax=Blautia sp. OM07-19 TaxID=2292985 RepID=UPI001A9AE3E1
YLTGWDFHPLNASPLAGRTAMLPSSFPVQKKKTQAISYDSRLTSLTIFYFYQLPARLVTGNPYT